MNCPIYTAASMIVSESTYPLGIACNFQQCEWFDEEEYRCCIWSFYQLFKKLNTEQQQRP